jgi:sensor histidine kinase YesM
MNTESSDIIVKRPFRAILLTMVFCTIIAVFLTSIRFSDGFIKNFIFSQCIGISICICVYSALQLVKFSKLFVQLSVIAAALTVGSIIGTFIGAVITGKRPALFAEGYGFFIHIVMMGVLFGSAISYFFISRERIAASRAAIQEENVKRLTSEKKMAETNLRLLQAQIEPHFLFNTLSNVLGLMDTDLQKGKEMLMDLIRYLRISLARTREERTSLGNEMESVKAYLDIYAVRMQERLKYRIDMPDRLKQLSFPPMLIQPLVENAIRHGIEPKVNGGEIRIRAKRNRDMIHVEIVDTGLGMREQNQSGIGLANIRERLRSLYGDKGRLILEENMPSGLKAVIEVPYVRDKGDHRR